MSRKKKEEIIMSQNTKKAVVDYTGSLLADIDFQNLDSIVSKITNNTKGLSDNTRIAASNFADEWERSITRHLDNKERRLEDFKRFFSCNVQYYGAVKNLFTPQTRYCDGAHVTDDTSVVQMALHALKSNPLWDKYVSRLETSISDYEELQCKIEELDADRDNIEIIPENASYDELVEITRKRSLHEAQINIKICQLQFLFCKKFGVYMRKLRSDQSIQNFVKDLDNQIKQVMNAKTIVHKKSKLIKLSINFGGTELLEVLKDLHDFQETL